MASNQGEKADDADDRDPLVSAGVRQFPQGHVIEYGFIVYNAQIDKASGKPNIQIQVRLFRNGEQFFAGKQQPMDVSGQTDLKRLTALGALQLSTDMTPGEYVFQIVVTDLLAKEKHRTTTQWIDFEIVK